LSYWEKIIDVTAFRRSATTVLDENAESLENRDLLRDWNAVALLLLLIAAERLSALRDSIT
jgi:hypothetical protein